MLIVKTTAVFSHWKVGERGLLGPLDIWFTALQVRSMVPATALERVMRRVRVKFLRCINILGSNILLFNEQRLRLLLLNNFHPRWQIRMIYGKLSHFCPDFAQIFGEQMIYFPEAIFLCPSTSFLSCLMDKHYNAWQTATFNWLLVFDII